jgi:hypothetical protein
MNQEYDAQLTSAQVTGVPGFGPRTIEKIKRHVSQKINTSYHYPVYFTLRPGMSCAAAAE